MRPYILGLNNPQSDDPVCALDMNVDSGVRLWRMANAACGVSQSDWLRLTQRQNLLNVTQLPRDWRVLAKARADWLRGLIEKRRVVLLGEDVAKFMGCRHEPMRWGDDRDWILLPHPSGLNRWYNEPAHRAAAGALLADLLYDAGYEGVRGGATEALVGLDDSSRHDGRVRDTRAPAVSHPEAYA